MREVKSEMLIVKSVFHTFPSLNTLMSNDYEEKRRKAYVNRRSLMDLGMGIIYAMVGGFFITAELFGIVMEFPPKPFSYIFGGLCLLYGSFRIYRGIKRNYFN